MHMDKSIIRDSGKRARAELGDAVRADYDVRIISRCQKELTWADYAAMMIFLPIARHNEIDTWPLLRWLWREWPDVAVYAPRVVGEKFEAIRLRPDTPVNTSDWGIPEPAGVEVLAPGEKLDLVLTPLLGFDAAGHRVGYGKGYFDRFFADFPYARRVGLGYECLLVRAGIPTQAHDMALNAVITEERIRTY
jgi:5-formyltetrahydrofolate cyclo-ligase